MDHSWNFEYLYSSVRQNLASEFALKVWEEISSWMVLMHSHAFWPKMSIIEKIKPNSISQETRRFVGKRRATRRWKAFCFYFKIGIKFVEKFQFFCFLKLTEAEGLRRNDRISWKIEKSRIFNDVFATLWRVWKLVISSLRLVTENTDHSWNFEPLSSFVRPNLAAVAPWEVCEEISIWRFFMHSEAFGRKCEKLRKSQMKRDLRGFVV